MNKFKIDFWITEKGLELLKLYANNGLTQVQIAKKMGCSTSTLKKYKDEYANIEEALSLGKDRLYDEVENTIYDMALGKTYKVKDYVKVKRGKDNEEVIEVDKEIFIPPQVAAASFVLRQKARFNETREKLTTLQKNINEGKVTAISINLEEFLDEV